MSFVRDLDPWGSLISADGELERPVVASGWRLPTGLISTDGDALSVGGQEPNDPAPPESTIVHPGRGMLEGFVRLSTAADQAIADYATRWGPLWLCGHGRPRSHGAGTAGDTDAYVLRCDLPPDGISRRSAEWGRTREPLAIWRAYAAKARALLRIASAAQSDDKVVRVSRVEWDALWLHYQWIAAYWFYFTPSSDAAEMAMDREYVRSALEVSLMGWIRESDVRPQLSLFGGSRIELGGAGLMGALGVALMLAMARTDGLGVCTACGTPYVPDRRPAAGRRAYCAVCRDNKVPRRDASRAWNTRNPDYYRERRAKKRIGGGA